MVSALSSVFGNIGEESAQKSFSEGFTALCPIAGDGHAHSFTEVTELLSYTENRIHVPYVNEVLFTPGLKMKLHT